MPTYSQTRGMLGPGYGKPVQQLRQMQTTEGSGKLYNPVSVDVHRCSVPAPQTQELLQIMRARRQRSSPDAPAHGSSGRASPVLLVSGRASPSSICASFNGLMVKPAAQKPMLVRHAMRAAPVLVPSPRAADSGSPRTPRPPHSVAGRSSTPQGMLLQPQPRPSGTWSRGPRFGSPRQELRPPCERLAEAALRQAIGRTEDRLHRLERLRRRAARWDVEPRLAITSPRDRATDGARANKRPLTPRGVAVEASAHEDRRRAASHRVPSTAASLAATSGAGYSGGAAAEAVCATSHEKGASPPAAATARVTGVQSARSWSGEVVTWSGGHLETVRPAPVLAPCMPRPAWRPRPLSPRPAFY